MTPRGAVIFDRDGVLNRDVGYACRAEQIEWIEDAVEAVRAVNAAGLLAFVATNQSGVARGYYTEADVQALHGWMAEQFAAAGARIDAFAYCPHHPEAPLATYRADCDSRKPGPGMIRRLLADHGVDPARALMIGDQPRDVEAAVAAGIEGVLFTGGSLLSFVAPLLARIAAAPAVTGPRS